MPFLKATSFNVVKAILIVVIVLSIIGSVAQLVAALFALAYAQDIDNINDQSLIGKKNINICSHNLIEIIKKISFISKLSSELFFYHTSEKL